MATLAELINEANRIKDDKNPSHSSQNKWIGQLMIDLLESPNIFAGLGEDYQYPTTVTYNDAGSTISGNLSNLQDRDQLNFVTDSGDVDFTFESVTAFDYLRLVYSVTGSGNAFDLRIENPADGGSYSSDLWSYNRTAGSMAVIDIPYSVVSSSLTVGNNININFQNNLGVNKTIKFFALVTEQG